MTVQKLKSYRVEVRLCKPELKTVVLDGLLPAHNGDEARAFALALLGLPIQRLISAGAKMEDILLILWEN